MKLFKSSHTAVIEQFRQVYFLPYRVTIGTAPETFWEIVDICC